LASCNPFHHEQAVQVDTKDENLNSRWHGTLATPAELAGAVQMNGSASMAPATKGGNTTVSLDLSNATPGGLHPWQLHRGQCGADDGVIGSLDAYKTLKVDEYGRASGAATLAFSMPMTGNYYVSVGASGANPETIVACGNLAPPSR